RLRVAFGVEESDGADIDVKMAGPPRAYGPSPNYLPEDHMSRGERGQRVEMLGRVVQDRRYYPEAEGGYTHRMPTSAFDDVAAGSPLYSQACREFIGTGYYEVVLEGTPMVVNLARVPGGGFRLRMADKGPPEYVDPDEDSPRGWVDRGSKRPADFSIVAIVLTSHRVHAAPVESKNGMRAA